MCRNMQNICTAARIINNLPLTEMCAHTHARSNTHSKPIWPTSRVFSEAVFTQTALFMSTLRHHFILNNKNMENICNPLWPLRDVLKDFMPQSSVILQSVALAPSCPHISTPTETKWLAYRNTDMKLLWILLSPNVLVTSWTFHFSHQQSYLPYIHAKVSFPLNNQCWCLHGNSLNNFCHLVHYLHPLCCSSTGRKWLLALSVWHSK